MPEQHVATRGVVASVAASVLFGLIFYLAAIVSVSAEEVFAWRVVALLVFYAAALAHPEVRRSAVVLWRRLRARWWMPLLLLFTAAIMGVQLWLFMWAPMHGQALEASLGYLLLPICLVLGGRFLLKSPVTRMQWCAAALAGIAVIVKLATSAELSWVTFVICVPYAAYFILRHRFGLDGSFAFGAEILLLTPLALWVLAVPQPRPSAGIGDMVVVVAVAVAGAAAMILYVAASGLLTIPVFGLLGYVEPVLLVVVALLLGERIEGADVIVYAVLMVALGLLAFEGVRALRRPVAR